jgi:hypothetical protein
MQPWATGPAEILEYALTLLVEDSDRNRRLAMIGIDNSVELAIKTYLGLPRRITGIEISRRDYQEMSESFPKLLDALERHCADKLEGVELGEVEWYHRLRNQLYHQGNGLTVEREKVRVYAELAKILYRNLFGAELALPKESREDSLGRFLSSWVKLEKAISKIAAQYRGDLAVAGGRIPPALVAMSSLHRLGVVSKPDLLTLERLRSLRNSLVHGEQHAEKLLTKETFSELDRMLAVLQKATKDA